MTEFRGRGDEACVRPLPFSEFMQAFEGDVYRGWAEYAVFGGTPLTLSMRTYEQKSRYLERLFAETYLMDVIARNKVAKTQEPEDLVDVLASSIGALTNPPKIEEARRHDVKGRRHIGTPKKYHFEDIGLRNARLGFRQDKETRIMENIVYNELRERGYPVDVGTVEKRSRDGGKTARSRPEVDFVANPGGRNLYIQSALHLPDPEKERQEKASLAEIPDSFRKLVLVRDVVKPTYDEHGIMTMSLYDFLLDGSI